MTVGTSSSDHLTGGSGSDVLEGLGGDDLLEGLGGNDQLDGGAGVDRTDGGAGDDVHIVECTSDEVIERAGEGLDTVFSSATYLLPDHVENLNLSGSAAIDATGNALVNRIRGNSGANTLDGGAGADRLKGGDGDDTYIVDHAGDVADESSATGGYDRVFASVSYTLGANVEDLFLSGAAAIDGTGNVLDNFIRGNDGANVLNGGAGADRLRGGDGDDSYFVDQSGDVVEETSATGGIDLVYSSVSHVLGANVENLYLRGSAPLDGTGNTLDNLLKGNSGANSLDGGAGADTMRGGAGDDTYFVDDAGDKAVETSSSDGTDLVRSSVSFVLDSYVDNLTLTGAAAIDATGNALANVLIGNDAANVLDGGIGADVLQGSAGDDTYVVDNAGDQVVETSSGHGSDLVRSSVSFVLGAHVENLTLIGSKVIDGTGNALANVLVGNCGANVLDGGSGSDVMQGAAGNDTYVVDEAGDQVVETSAGHGTDLVRSSVGFVLGAHLENLTLIGTSAIDGTGNALANVLVGNSAANILDGGTGADVMQGVAGNDTYVVDEIGDQVVETSSGHGVDLVRSSISFVLGAHLENLTLDGASAIDGTGNGLANVILGNGAANTLDGGGGADRLEGAAGDDTYRVDHSGDEIVESAGNGLDRVESSVSHVLDQNVEELILIGSAGINGTGNGLDNVLTGNAGGNRLDGGIGDDVLTGGDGGDGFAFTTVLGIGNVDIVTDFTPGLDQIFLGGASGEAFAALASGALGPGAFRLGAVAADSDDRILYDSSSGVLLYDADGAGGLVAVQFATLTPGLSLSASNFFVTGPANGLPAINSGGTANVNENVPPSTIVYRTVASDPDGDSIVFSLTGADAAHFTIDQSGTVRIIASPDFETRSGYSFTVNAVDSSGSGASRTVNLTVNNVGESAYLVNETAAPNDGVSSAQPLDRGSFSVTGNGNLPDPSLPSAVITGSISVPSDQDWFSITLEEGELLILDVDGTTTLDSWVTVLDSSGNELTFNDDQVAFDSGSSAHSGISHNLDSLVRFRAPEGGTYYFSIRSYFDESGPSSSGGYTLNVSIGPPADKAQIDEENIEALLSGATWNTLNLTYGFTSIGSQYGPGEGTDEIAAGMAPLNVVQQSAVRTMVGQIASLTNLTFTELAGSPGSAQLRYALSNEPETAHAYYPGSGNGGDSWYNTTGYTSPAVGNYHWMTFLHETGHALGLKHGHEAPPLSFDRDSLEFSVMTYRSYVGDSLGNGYRNETWGFAQTLMMYDIAALQRMYGADFSLNAGDTTYSWSPSTGAFLVNGATQWTPGANRVFMTIWDGNGTDTYDLSSYSNGVTIDLRPGEWTITSAVQRANLGDGHMARGNVANALLFNGDSRSLIENAVGGSAGDLIIANQAANSLTGGGGGDTFAWRSSADAGLGALGDAVTDFNPGQSDRIDLSAIDANPLTEGDEAFAFLGTGAFTGNAGELRYEVIDGNARLLADLNGDSVADLQITLNGITFLGGSEFNL